MAWASRRKGPSWVRKSGPSRGLNFNNAVCYDAVPPAVAKARVDTGWSVSACRGASSGDDAELERPVPETAVHEKDQAARPGIEMASGCLGPVTTPSLQTEFLERRRRDAPWVSSAAKETKRARPSVSKAICIASSDDQMIVARENYRKLIYASGTSAAKDSHLSLWAQICKERGLPNMPISPESIHEVGSVLRAAGYRSGYSYVLDAKLEHIRKGHTWNEALELALHDAKRALTRRLGGAAEEMRLEWLPSLPVVERDDGRLPRGGPLAWAFGMRFLLREVELSSIVVADLIVDLICKHITLIIPVSKTDTRAAGCRRTLACRNPNSREECEGLVCPFCVAVRALRIQEELTGVTSPMDEAKEVPLFGQQHDPFSVVEKEMMIEAAKQDAAWLVEAIPEAAAMNPGQITGHFMRRSGCKRLAREGVPREAIKHLARHSSSAVDGYVEEAAEEAPGAHLWAQKQIDTARQLEGVRKEQERINSKMSAQEKLAWREKDIIACVEKVVEEQGLQAAPPPEVFEQIISREANAAVAKAVNPSFLYNVRARKLRRIAQCHVQINPEGWTTFCGWPWNISNSTCRVLMSETEAPADHVVCKRCSRHK